MLTNKNKKEKLRFKGEVKYQVTIKWKAVSDANHEFPNRYTTSEVFDSQEDALDYYNSKLKLNFTQKDMLSMLQYKFYILSEYTVIEDITLYKMKGLV